MVLKQKKSTQLEKEKVIAELESEYQVFHQRVVKILDNYQQVVNGVLREIEARKLEEVRKKIKKI